MAPLSSVDFDSPHTGSREDNEVSGKADSSEEKLETLSNSDDLYLAMKPMRKSWSRDEEELVETEISTQEDEELSDMEVSYWEDRRVDMEVSDPEKRPIGMEVSNLEEGLVDMEEDIWKRLPEELIYRILCRLPLYSIFRLRSVCKAWHSVLHNPAFYAEVGTQVPLCIRQADSGYAAYNPASNLWHFWPYTLFSSNFSTILSTSSVPFWASGAAGGLLLLEGYGDDGRALHVANPMNRSQKKLPLLEELQDSFTSSIVGMVSDEVSGSYKVLAIHHGVHDELFLYENFLSDLEDAEEPFKFFVYDSKYNSWEMTGSWLRGVRQNFQSPAYHNGSMYCLTSDLEPFHLSESPPKYHVYRIGQQEWLELPAELPSCLNFGHLFVNRGHLMLGGGTAGFNGLGSVSIWKLDEASLRWIEVKSMPTYLIEVLSIPMEPYFGTHFSCVADGDYISVTSFSRKLNVCNTVMCNLRQDCWWLLPPNKQRSHPASFLFEPRLDVVV